MSHLTGLGVDIQDVLIAEIDRASELAGDAVELPENPQLAHREQRALAVVVDQDALERLVHVVRVAGDVLVVPLHLTGRGVERKRRVAVERVTGRAARVAVVRLGLRRTPVDESGDRVIAPGHPGVASRAKQERQIAPGVAAALAGASDGRGSPEQPAGAAVDADDVAGVVTVTPAACHPGDDRPIDDDRSVRKGVAFLAARDRRIPARLARPRVQPDDVRIESVQDDQILVDGKAAHLRRASPPLVHLAAILPQEVARARVERLDHIARVRDIHDAVVHDRRRLRHPGFEAPGPNEPEFIHVAPVDLIERAVPPPIEGAPPAQPVGGVGILQHRVGDQGRVLGLRLTGIPHRHGDAGAYVHCE